MSGEEPMSQHEQDETSDAAPDSGTEPLQRRAETAAAGDFETEEERRFFSVAPEPDAQHAAPSLEPVVAASAHGEDEGPETTPAEREWLARAEARRATLQRWVGLAIAGGAAALAIAGADRYLAAKNDATRNLASAVLPAADSTPTKKSAPTRTTAARSADGAPSSTSVPVSAPSASSSTSTPPVHAPSTTSAAPAAAVVPAFAPSATSFPLAPAQAPSATRSPAPAAVAGESDAAGLREKARTLLATGHSRDGVAFARAAVESDPADARSYVLLGAGLQDLGDWAGAREVFQACTQKAERGPQGACQYFARR
jgi:hypothetical protein